MAGTEGAASVHVSLEFGGGLDLLFDRQKHAEVDVPVGPSGEVTMRSLILWVRNHLLRERPELFVSEDGLRPGILCLVNDADWELEGTVEYRVQDGDRIAFISTLHGG